MSRERESSGGPLRVEADALRDHGDQERIDRVWERLEPKLTLGRTPRRSTGKLPLVAAAVAAGFALGIATSGWLGDGDHRIEAVAPDSTGVPQTADVFAAGASPRSYSLPGGGSITLEPGSIVDTVSVEGRALTLRLVRGDATVASPADAGSIDLMIGSARLATPAGARMQVRREGDHAFVRMFEGSAELTAPTSDEELTVSRLGPNDARRFRVRVTTASIPDDPRPDQPRVTDGPVDDGDEGEDIEGSDEPTTVEPKPWEIACKEGDDEQTLKLLQAQPDVLAKVTDPRVLACVARGQRSTGNTTGAIAAYDKVMAGADPLRAYNAARAVLSILNRRLSKATSITEKQMLTTSLAKYAQKEKRLALAAVARGIDLTPFMGAQSMCRRIQAEAGITKPNWEAVANLAAQYKKAFPTGDCIATIDGILARQPAPADEAEDGGAAPEGDEDSPYEEPKD